MLYRIGTDDSVDEVPTTTTLDEDVYEKRVETWIEARPDMLGEQLLVIGRQLSLGLVDRPGVVVPQRRRYP
jgi:hypothetical protein